MAERWLRAVGDDEEGGSSPRAYDEGRPGSPSWADGPRECACDGCVADIMAGMRRGRHSRDVPDAEDGGGGGGGGAPGRLTEIAFIDGELVDIRRGPVQGSGYECVAYELAERGLLRRERPRTVTVREEPQEAMLDWLARVVGGEGALSALDVLPLPAGEELDLSAVPGWARERARVVDEHVQDAFGHEIVGPELLTACRRLLVRAAGAGAFEGWRRSRPEQVAAGLVHCAARLNDLNAQSYGVSMASLLQGIGVKGYPTEHSRRIATLLGGPAWPHGRRPTEVPDVYVLGDASLLLSSFRRSLVAYRGLATRLAPPTA